MIDIMNFVAYSLGGVLTRLIERTCELYWGEVVVEEEVTLQREPSDCSSHHTIIPDDYPDHRRLISTLALCVGPPCGTSYLLYGNRLCDCEGRKGCFFC